MDLDIFNHLESEVRGYIRDFPVVFDKAVGSTMVDTEGNRYTDLFAGAGALNYGHNNPIMKKELLSYIESDSISHSLDMATVAKSRFLEAMESIILKPRGLDYKIQFTGPTGTNAIEAALKLARQVTGRSTVVAFTRAFHGMSGGSLAATAGSSYRRAAGYPLHDVTFVPYDGYLGTHTDTIAYLETLLADSSSGLDEPAAVIVETVQAEGGVNVASAPWLRALSELCERRGILLIVDDIQVGCGRTGEFFSFEEAGIRPDIVTLSKSISGYGLPMSLVLMRRDLDIWKPGAHSGTFRGNNMAFVCATVALETYWTTTDLTEDVRRKGDLIAGRFAAIAAANPELGFTSRGRGLIRGLESTAMPELAERISHDAFAHGVVVETSGPKHEVLKVLPSLTIPDDQLEHALDVIEDCVARVLERV
jgi:diaminobutyrate-2-oxoglutarate transaminase